VLVRIESGMRVGGLRARVAGRGRLVRRGAVALALVAGLVVVEVVATVGQSYKRGVTFMRGKKYSSRQRLEGWLGTRELVPHFRDGAVRAENNHYSTLAPPTRMPWVGDFSLVSGSKLLDVESIEHVEPLPEHPGDVAYDYQGSRRDAVGVFVPLAYVVTRVDGRATAQDLRKQSCWSVWLGSEPGYWRVDVSWAGVGARVLVAGGVFAGLVLGSALVERSRRRRSRCVACGHALLAEQVQCPECGVER